MVLTHKKVLFLITFFALFTSVGVSQVNVTIGANKLEGCAPFEVLFNSTVNNCTGTINYSWNFGFVGGNSSQANPGTVFQNSGTYTVTLTVSCAYGTATDNLTIIVHKPPTAVIGNSLVKGCKPLSVNFNDASTAGDGAINTWQWFFNDGTPLSTLQNPSHTYDFAGIFNVMLIVTDVNGCSSQITEPALVSVSDTPQISFNAYPISYCNPPLTVNFQSNVNTNFNLPYQAIWNFGDGSPNGSGTNVQHTYTNSSIYDVELIVIDDYGCSNSVKYEDYINITELIPDFNMFVGSTQVTPGSVLCKNTSVHFTNLTAYNCSWDFGNGQTSSLNIVNHTFSQPGTYNIRFTVQPGGDCENFIDFVLFVEDITAGFTTNPSNLSQCNVPFTVQFTNTSSANATNYEYTFGDGDISNSPNTSHTYTSNGTFPVVLTVTSDNGCAATYSKQVIINSPDASFSFQEGEGCAPLNETFEYTGTSALIITNYTWNFGDGSAPLTQNPPVSHVFQNSGEYTVTLTVTDGTCTSSSTQTINVGNPIHGNLTFQLFDDILNDWYNVTDLVHCAQDTFRIINPLFDHPDIDDFEWELDSIHDESAEEFTFWAFDQDTGYVSVMFVTNFNGCRDTLHLDSIFYINGPVIKSIQKEFDCEDPFKYTFKVNILNLDNDLTLNWDWFIDQGETGNINIYQSLGSTSDEIIYTFPGLGSYWVRVLARSSTTGCEFVDSIKVDVYQASANFVASSYNFCTGTTVYFDASSSASAVSYSWDFGDGQTQEESNNPITNHQFNGYGDFIVTLTIKDNNGCEAIYQRTVHSSGPSVQIITNPDPAHGCNSLSVDFSFNYTSDYPLSYNFWQISGFPQSIYSTTFTKTFGPGTYDVTLNVSNTNGCTASVTMPALVVVSSIEAQINTANPVECVGVPVQFNSSLQNNLLNYSWQFGDGQNSTEINPQHIYTHNGIYDVSLQIDDGYGCVSNDQVQIEVQSIDINFSLAQTEFNCYPAFLEITNNSDPNLYNPSWEWTFGTGDTLPVFEPHDFFINDPGEFWVKLQGTTGYGCVSSDSIKVEISGPVFHYYYSPTTICLHDTVHFEITDMQGNYNIRWYIRGTQFTTTSVDYVFNEMPPNGITEVQLIVEHSSCEVLKTMIVNIQQVNADFFVVDSLGNMLSGSCSPFEFNLINNSQGANYINWDVAGQTFATTDTLHFNFVNNSINDSIFSIQCIGKNELGCTDTITKSYTIFGRPNLLISKDTIICKGDNINLFVSGGTQAVWQPNLFINDTSSISPIVNPENNIVYYVSITDSNNCTANDSVQINVQQIPEFDLSPAYDSIIIGDTVYITTNVNQDGVTYSWSPQIDISCNNCAEPFFFPKQDQRYTVSIQDSIGCFKHDYFLDIYVIAIYSLDVPSAFTPLGHETNRIIYAKGYGIKHFIEFRIYNRWGEEVFFTDDINVGWDGYYKGQLQNIDTYKYFVRAEMWNGEIYVKKGDILLMR